MQLSQSTLIQACIDCGSLERARQVYAAMGEQGRAPSLQAMNNLINAHSRACRLGDVVSLVEDLVAAGMRPDAFTFAAILNACQRTNEAELAFDVYRSAPMFMVAVLIRLSLSCRPGFVSENLDSLIPGRAWAGCISGTGSIALA